MVTRLGRLELVAGSPRGQVDVLVRPEQVSVSSVDDPHVDAAGVAVVDRVEFAGATTSLELLLGDLRLGARVLGSTDLTVGARG